jgi:SSS family solute:Na+ symporter
VLVMVVISLKGPKVSPNAFELDRKMFKLQTSSVILIIFILLILMALYVRFW